MSNGDVTYSIRFYNDDGQFEAEKINGVSEVVGAYSWGNKRIGHTNEPTAMSFLLMDVVDSPYQYTDLRAEKDGVVDFFNGKNLLSPEEAKEVVGYWQYRDRNLTGEVRPLGDNLFSILNITTFEDVSRHVALVAGEVSMDESNETAQYVAQFLQHALFELPDIQRNTYHEQLLEKAKGVILESGLRPHGHKSTNPVERQLETHNYLYCYDD